MSIQANKILLEIIRWEEEAEPFAWTREGYLDNRKNLDRAIRELVENKLIIEVAGGFAATQEGRDFAKDIAKNPSANNSPVKFREEALTGMRVAKSKTSGYRVTRRSEISSAVLPSCKQIKNTRTPEDELDDVQTMMAARDKLLLQLGISADELYDLANQDRLRTCSGGGREHIGIFDKNGAGWRNVCRACRKK